jgi:uroporphyrinogen-III synthase
MHLIVTRPQTESARTANALRARGHEVLEAPMMRVESLAADLAGSWGAVIVTSANAPAAVADNPARASILNLPVFAVGRRTAEAAREAGFENVVSAGGDVHDLVNFIAERRADAQLPLLYLAGENRAADLVSELAARAVTVEMRSVYRAVTTPLPPRLVSALRSGEIDGVLHFSRRSAENYLAGARQAGLLEQALGLRHFCLSAQVAAPLIAAGALNVSVSPLPEEATLLSLVEKASSP